MILTDTLSVGTVGSLLEVLDTAGADVVGLDETVRGEVPSRRRTFEISAKITSGGSAEGRGVGEGGGS